MSNYSSPPITPGSNNPFASPSAPPRNIITPGSNNPFAKPVLVTRPSNALEFAEEFQRKSTLHDSTSILPDADPNSTVLTPLRAHYLKKHLINLEIEREINALSNPKLGASALGLLGPPFASLTPDGKPMLRTASRGDDLAGDLPFLQYMFHQFLLPFPFLAAAPATFWPNKVQPFLGQLFTISQSRSSSTIAMDANGVPDLTNVSEEDLKEYNERKKIWDKVHKNLSLMIASGIKLENGEEVVRIGQNDLRKLEAQSATRKKRWEEREKRMGTGFDVNVICVRNVMEKGRVRKKSHDEFIIRTKRPNAPDTFVSRRYGDFRRLAEELRTQFPEAPLPPPPPKDRTASTAPTTTQTPYYSAYNPLRAIYGANPAGTSSPATASSSVFSQASGATGSSDDLSRDAAVDSSSPLAREKNRLTLRAYLSAILAMPFVLNSPMLRSFLLSSPTQLNAEEEADARRRAEADAVREEGRRRFKEEAEKRVEALREGLGEFKGDVLGKKGGLKGVFDVVKRVENVKDLPKAEASVLEWGRISLAATVFQLFVAADGASDSFAQFKRLHGLMPYFMLKGILKISNPMAMIRGVLDLFLARPFGGQSLLQRMFSTSLMEEVRALDEDIEVISGRINDSVLCEKVQLYVESSWDVQEVLRKDAASENIDLIAIILRSHEAPSLDRAQMQRVIKANRAYKSYKTYQSQLDDSDDDEGPENQDAWLFEDLNVLLKLFVRKKEKAQLLALIFEGVTAELLKDIITIFYSPLAQVYKAASIADSLGDLQNFFNDLIRTVESVEELSQEDPQRTVQMFIDLVQRHEQSFYSFVHKVHLKGEGLFDALMLWVELFLNYARDGLDPKVDLEFLLPHAGEERMVILRELDSLAAYHYKLKIAHEEKIRRRFAKDSATDEEAALMDSVVSSLHMDESILREGGDGEDEESDEDTDEEEEEEAALAEAAKNQAPIKAWKGKEAEQTGAVADSEKGRSSMERLRNSVDFGRHKGDKSEKSDVTPEPDAAKRTPRPKAPLASKKKRRLKKDPAEDIEFPVLKVIPSLRPILVEMIRPMLVANKPHLLTPTRP